MMLWLGIGSIFFAADRDLADNKKRLKVQITFCFPPYRDHHRQRSKSHSEWLMRRHRRKTHENPSRFFCTIYLAWLCVWRKGRCCIKQDLTLLSCSFRAESHSDSCLNISWSVKASQFPSKQLPIEWSSLLNWLNRMMFEVKSGGSWAV